MKLDKTLCALLVYMATCALTLTVAYAATSITAISAVDPGTHLPISTTTTVSILLLNPVTQAYDDMTSSWLPEPGQNVFIVVKSAGAVITPNSISLVAPPVSITFDGATNPFINASVLTTSAYPGQCTNFGSPTDLSPDFTLSSVPTTLPGGAIGFQLTPTDCGGMAVIQVIDTAGATSTFILPQDTDADGIPDIYETLMCGTAICLNPRDDTDAAPVNSPLLGDGIAAFDEYRGFIVSGKHIRTDPGHKDLFVHLVNPQCNPAGANDAATTSLLGFARSEPGTRTIYTTDTSSIFTALNTLISGTQIHVLGLNTMLDSSGKPRISTNYLTNEWVDNFLNYGARTGIAYQAGTNGLTSDRQINANAVFPVLDTVTNLKTQKGVRLIECAEPTAIASTQTLGVGEYGTPNVYRTTTGPVLTTESGNAIVFTHRIADFVICTNTGGTMSVTVGCTPGTSHPTLQFQSYTGGKLTTKTSITLNDLITKAIMFYFAMEIGHTTQLTTTSTNNFHKTAGMGDNLDQFITSVATKSGTQITNILWKIPSEFLSDEQANFHVHN
jgi:hypothetical protein